MFSSRSLHFADSKARAFCDFDYPRSRFNHLVSVGGLVRKFIQQSGRRIRPDYHRFVLRPDELLINRMSQKFRQFIVISGSVENAPGLAMIFNCARSGFQITLQQFRDHRAQ